MSNHILPGGGPRKSLPTSKPDKLVQIIKGYVVASEEGRVFSDANSVGNRASVAPAVIRQNEPFLVASGLLAPGPADTFKPTGPAVRFAREAATNREREATSHLVPAITTAWYTKIVSNVFAETTVAPEAFVIDKLASAAGVTPMDPSLIFLVDFLLWAQLLLGPSGGHLSPGPNLPQIQSSPVSRIASPQPGQQLSVAVNVNISATDLTPETAVRVREWIDSLLRRG